MIYRKAVRSDIPELAEIRKKQLIDEGMNPDREIRQELQAFFQKHFEDDTLVEFLALENDETAATAAILFMEYPPTFANPSGIRGYVTNMYTAPAYRGRGLASGMLERLMKEAEERGVTEILLHASGMGRSVYERFGFTGRKDWMGIRLPAEEEDKTGQEMTGICPSEPVQ